MASSDGDTVPFPALSLSFDQDRPTDSPGLGLGLDDAFHDGLSRQLSLDTTQASSRSHSLSSLPTALSDAGSIRRAPTVPSQAAPEASSAPDDAFPAHDAYANIPRSSTGAAIIHRISRKAKTLPRRMSTSSSTQKTRDQAAGPHILRHRGNSLRKAHEAGDEEDPLASATDQNIPPPARILTSHGAGSTDQPESDLLRSFCSFEHQDTPLRSRFLEQGSPLTKVTPKKSKTILFRLDFDAAKICWQSQTSSHSLYIDDIKEIRLGDQTRHDREECGVSDSVGKRWFTVIYSDPEKYNGRNTKAMHLVAGDDVAFQAWTNALNALSHSRRDLMIGLAGLTDRSIQSLWANLMRRISRNDATTGHLSEKVDFPTLVSFCQSLHILSPENHLKELFKRLDRAGSGLLGYLQFRSFLTSLRERKEVAELYSQLTAAEPGRQMSQSCFLQFVQDVQKVDVGANADYWKAVFDKYAATGADTSARHMSVLSFQAFLTSKINSPLKPIVKEPVLNQPLNDYFISSSHNTYLIGRQVVGVSSTEPYILTLKEGCRCVEIDCWDGPDGKPVVTHGHTATTEVPFSKVIRVVSEYAFHSTDYPLILSLEVHCCPQQQIKMSQIMRDEFGDSLLLAPLSSSHILPSPEELKRKILVKVKAPTLSDPASTPVSATPSLPAMSPPNPVTNGNSSVNSTFSTGINTPTTASSNVTRASSTKRSRALSAAFSRSQTQPPAYDASTMVAKLGASLMAQNQASESVVNVTGRSGSTVSVDDSDSGTPVSAGAGLTNRSAPKTSNIIPYLGDLGVYSRGYKFTGFDQTAASYYNHIFSLNESKFNSLCREKSKSDSKLELELHNVRYLMRVYPHGLRLSSGNFDVLKTWRRGVQMAALNWQTNDINLQINTAMFSGGSDWTGYVLKPAEMRSGHQPRPRTDLEYPYTKKRSQIKFTVDIISGQQLPRPKNFPDGGTINPYVEIELHSADDKERDVATGEGGTDVSARNGMLGTGSPLRKRTRVTVGNGFNPVFKETISMTLTTKYPSLAFVRWTVWHSHDGKSQSSDAPLATYTAKLGSLRPGYHHIPLFDSNGEQYMFSTLFVKMDRREPVVGEDVVLPSRDQLDTVPEQESETESVVELKQSSIGGRPFPAGGGGGGGGDTGNGPAGTVATTAAATNTAADAGVGQAVGERRLLSGTGAFLNGLLARSGERIASRGSGKLSIKIREEERVRAC